MTHNLFKSMILQTNKENNNIWKSIVGVATGVLLIIDAIFVVSKRQS